MYNSYDPFAKCNQETSTERMAERRNKVNTFLNDKDEEEVYRDIVVLLNSFVNKHPEYTANLAGQIGDFVKTSIKTKDKDIRDKERGIENIAWIIEDKKEWNSSQYVRFGHEFMKAYFPKATTEHCLDFMKKYFDEYVQALKECKDEIIDSNWAVNTVEMNDYFKKLLEE